MASLSSRPTPVVDDEAVVMARTSGWLWLCSCVVVLLALLLPGANRDHVELLLALMIPVGIHGAMSVAGLGWTQVTHNFHGVTALVLYPLVGVALYATGGTDSYVQPLLGLIAIYLGYFFGPRWRWVLTAELLLIAGTPLYVDWHGAVADHYVTWLFVFSAATVATTFAVAKLKDRLVVAEQRQRTIAHRDALTGLANRRAYDAVLEASVAAGRPFALLFLDLDDFKGVNDRHGHVNGDRVLREVAERTTESVRDGDTLARIGGDELALIAPGARAFGAEGLAIALTRAVAEVSRGPGDGPMSATIATAVFPDDGRTADQLVAAADTALHERKRARRAVVAETRRRAA
jgi:diguanylate cyclase (GGDEF)-like protein